MKPDFRCRVDWYLPISQLSLHELRFWKCISNAPPSLLSSLSLLSSPPSGSVFPPACIKLSPLSSLSLKQSYTLKLWQSYIAHVDEQPTTYPDPSERAGEEEREGKQRSNRLLCHSLHLIFTAEPCGEYISFYFQATTPDQYHSSTIEMKMTSVWDWRTREERGGKGEEGTRGLIKEEMGEEYGHKLSFKKCHT